MSRFEITKASMDVYRHTIKTRCKYCESCFDSFNFNKVCPKCTENMEEYYKQIREFRNADANASEDKICAELHIPMLIIKKFLSEERLLMISQQRGYAIKCKRCEKPIHKGRYCSDCEILVTSMEMRLLKKNK